MGRPPATHISMDSIEFCLRSVTIAILQSPLIRRYLNQNELPLSMKNKEHYEELAKEFSLPEFEKLDQEFGLGDIDKENILFGIKERILDRIDSYAKIIEGIIQPETSLTDMYESKVFSDEEKQNMFIIYKRFIYLDRYSMQTELEDGNIKLAEFISESYKEWLKIKDKVLAIIVKLKESWTKDDENAFSPEYFG